VLDCRAEEILVRHLTFHHIDEVEDGRLGTLDALPLARATRLPVDQVERLLKDLKSDNGRPWPYWPVSVDYCYSRVHLQVAREG